MRFEEVNGNIFYNGDCIRGAREHIPDGSVDLIVTDPPYGINGDRLHQHYNRMRRSSSRVTSKSRSRVRGVQQEVDPGGRTDPPARRVDLHRSGYTNLYHILHALRQTGLREVNHIIWKYNFGVYTSRKYVSSHYHILFYEKPGEEDVQP
jgi:site-specific DNA-methyltransferase (adenine-specific)